MTNLSFYPGDDDQDPKNPADLPADEPETEEDDPADAGVVEEEGEAFEDDGIAEGAEEIE